MIQKNVFVRILAAKWCLLMLGMLLLLAACGSDSNPGSQPNSPQATPTQSGGGGYSIITLIEEEIHFFLAP